MDKSRKMALAGLLEPPSDFQAAVDLGYKRKLKCGIIPESARNPEIIYTAYGQQTAAAVLLTFLLLKPEISDIVKSTGKPVICSDFLCEDLEREFIKYHNEKTECNDPYKYIGYAAFNGPVAVAQHSIPRLKELNLGKPSGDAPTAESLLSLVVAAQSDPARLAALMGKVQRNPYLKRVPETLCHEIGHLSAMENALAQEDTTIRSWSDYVFEVLDPERKDAHKHAGPVDAKHYDYYLTDTNEASAQLIGEALLLDLKAQHNTHVNTIGFSRLMPRSFSDIYNMVVCLTGPIHPQPNKYIPPELEW